MTTVPLLDLVQIDEYQAARENLFPSRSSIDWFIRQHRAELGQAGALIAPTGRLMVAPERFDAVAIEVGTRRASTSRPYRPKRD